MILPFTTYGSGVVPVTGGGVDPDPPPVTGYYGIKQHETGTRYNAWGDMDFFRTLDSNPVRDIFYSSTLFHGGNSQLRWRTTNKYGDELSNIILWDDPDESRRDAGGGSYINDDGNTVYIVRYVRHDMTVTSLPTVLWGMIGMGHYRIVFSGTTEAMLSLVDYPTSFDPQGEPDYANYGNLERHPITGRLYAAAYGTTNGGRTLLYKNDADGVGNFDLLYQTTPDISDQLDEGAIVILDGGTGNSDAIIAEFKRNTVGKLRLFISSDGGTTFPFDQELSYTSTASKAPWCFKDAGIVYVYWTDRASQNYAIRGQKFDAAILATAVEGVGDTARIGPVMTTYISMANSHPLSAGVASGNFGYMTGKANGAKDTWLGNCYDQSPTMTDDYDDALADNVQCDQMMFPLFGTVRVKAMSNATQTFPNGTTQVVLADTAIDNHGAWENNEFTAPVAGTYEVCINLPISYQGNKTLEVRKYLAATPSTLDSTPYSIVELEGLSSAVGKLQGYTSIALAEGDILRFFVIVSGASSSPTSGSGGTLNSGVYHSIDITNAVAREGNIQAKIAASVQTFLNNVEQQVTGAEVTDTDNAYSAAGFTLPLTEWYRIRLRCRFPNAPGGRRVLAVNNYEVGYEDQETRRQTIFQMEDKARTGTNTDSDAVFYYRGNKGETIRPMFTVYGIASIDSVAGSFNSIEIEQM